jgi:prolipoprotein diacylglyceryltransferase
MGQLLSLPMLLAGVVLLVLARRWQQPSGNFKPAP